MGLRDTDYATVPELAAFMHISDQIDDVTLALAVTAASRAIDQACDRAFGIDDPAVARRYTLDSDCLLLSIDDIATTTSLAVAHDPDDEATALVLNTDYYMEPRNAVADGLPFTRLRLDSQLTGDISITAKFGWAAVPSSIKQATLLQASRLVKRRDAPFGVAGSPEMGSEMRLLARLDPDVAVLIAAYRRFVGVW